MTVPAQSRPPADRGHRAPNGGYLLVEVLATMTISAFILAALLSIVFFTIRASQRIDRQTQAVENVGRVMAALAREIQQAAPLRWGSQGSGFVFSGDAMSLMFARENLSADGAADDQAVILRNANGQLLLSETPLLPNYRSASELVAAPQQPVLDRRFQVRFAYFSRLGNGQEALTDKWTDALQMPVAVRVSMTDGTGRLVGSTRVALRVDAEPGCAAPTKLNCSFATNVESADDAQPAAESKVEADDQLGWGRYAQ